ncbi:M20/M25/M40 family metallo-hydrolase [Teichococcus aestuarii]
MDALMRERGEDGRGTVGQLHVLPNSRNVVPGEVRFSIEFRHPDDVQIEGLAATFPAEAKALAEANGCTLDLTELFRIRMQPFDAGCVDLVRQGAARLGYSTREIVSGAGHDAVYVARSVPTAMIFTPCKDGLSHNEAESILPEEAAAGCRCCSRRWWRAPTGRSDQPGALNGLPRNRSAGHGWRSGSASGRARAQSRPCHS